MPPRRTWGRGSKGRMGRANTPKALRTAHGISSWHYLWEPPRQVARYWLCQLLLGLAQAADGVDSRTFARSCHRGTSQLPGLCAKVSLGGGALHTSSAWPGRGPLTETQRRRAVLQESAVELLFAAFFTTASASTSLVLLLLQHPAAIAKIRQELEAQGLGRACSCGPGAAGDGAGHWSDCGCAPDLSLAALGGLPYVDCVVKEVLRLLPPVSGGYRTALRTFELDVSAPTPPPAPPPAASVLGAGGGGGGGW